LQLTQEERLFGALRTSGMLSASGFHAAVQDARATAGQGLPTPPPTPLPTAQPTPLPLLSSTAQSSAGAQAVAALGDGASLSQKLRLLDAMRAGDLLSPGAFRAAVKLAAAPAAVPAAAPTATTAEPTAGPFEGADGGGALAGRHTVRGGWSLARELESLAQMVEAGVLTKAQFAAAKLHAIAMHEQPHSGAGARGRASEEDRGDRGAIAAVLAATAAPAGNPSTAQPSVAPTALPTDLPTAAPSSTPTAMPTAAPSSTPTAMSTAASSSTPTAVPTAARTSGKSDKDSCAIPAGFSNRAREAMCPAGLMVTSSNVAAGIAALLSAHYAAPAPGAGALETCTVASDNGTLTTSLAFAALPVPVAAALTRMRFIVFSRTLSSRGYSWGGSAVGNVIRVHYQAWATDWRPPGGHTAFDSWRPTLKVRDLGSDTTAAAPASACTAPDPDGVGNCTYPVASLFSTAAAKHFAVYLQHGDVTHYYGETLAAGGADATAKAQQVELLKKPSGDNGGQLLYLAAPDTPLFEGSVFDVRVKTDMAGSDTVGLLQVEMFWDNTKLQLTGKSSHVRYTGDWGPTLSCTEAQVEAARLAQNSSNKRALGDSDCTAAANRSVSALNGMFTLQAGKSGVGDGEVVRLRFKVVGQASDSFADVVYGQAIILKKQTGAGKIDVIGVTNTPAAFANLPVVGLQGPRPAAGEPSAMSFTVLEDAVVGVFGFPARSATNKLDVVNAQVLGGSVASLPVSFRRLYQFKPSPESWSPAACASSAPNAFAATTVAGNGCSASAGSGQTEGVADGFMTAVDATTGLSGRVPVRVWFPEVQSVAVGAAVLSKISTAGCAAAAYQRADVTVAVKFAASAGLQTAAFNAAPLLASFGALKLTTGVAGNCATLGVDSSSGKVFVEGACQQATPMSVAVAGDSAAHINPASHSALFMVTGEAVDLFTALFVLEAPRSASEAYEADGTVTVTDGQDQHQHHALVSEGQRAHVYTFGNSGPGWRFETSGNVTWTNPARMKRVGRRTVEVAAGAPAGCTTLKSTTHCQEAVCEIYLEMPAAKKMPDTMATASGQRVEQSALPRRLRGGRVLQEGSGPAPATAGSRQPSLAQAAMRAALAAAGVTGAQTAATALAAAAAAKEEGQGAPPLVQVPQGRRRRTPTPPPTLLVPQAPSSEAKAEAGAKAKAKAVAQSAQCRCRMVMPNRTVSAAAVSNWGGGTTTGAAGTAAGGWGAATAPGVHLEFSAWCERLCCTAPTTAGSASSSSAAAASALLLVPPGQAGPAGQGARRQCPSDCHCAGLPAPSRAAAVEPPTPTQPSDEEASGGGRWQHGCWLQVKRAGPWRSGHGFNEVRGAGCGAPMTDYLCSTNDVGAPAAGKGGGAQAQAAAKEAATAVEGAVERVGADWVAWRAASPALLERAVVGASAYPGEYKVRYTFRYRAAAPAGPEAAGECPSLVQAPVVAAADGGEAPGMGAEAGGGDTADTSGGAQWQWKTLVAVRTVHVTAPAPAATTHSKGV
jgi:hypothetical protein